MLVKLFIKINLVELESNMMKLNWLKINWL